MDRVKSLLAGLATLMAAGVAEPCFAREICGLSEASFKPSTNTSIAGGLGPALGTVSPPAKGQSPTISITHPAPGSSLPEGRVQVAGTVSGPVNTGVSVNGAPAHVQDGVFLTPEITFGEDVNTLTAEASTMDALTATATSVVTVSEIPAEARLTADADAGFAPLPVNFHLSLVEGLTVQSVNVDFDGDGIIDYTGTSIGDLPLTTYTQPGIYTATATITLTDDQEVVAERKVIAVDLARQRETVCAVYAHLRASLASQDADQAGTALASHLKTRLMPMFAALGPRMPEVAKNLGILADGVIGLNRAEIISVVDNHTEVRGYPIQFAPDASGVWRIDSM